MRGLDLTSAYLTVADLEDDGDEWKSRAASFAKVAVGGYGHPGERRVL
jgi:hypothetical protein